MQEERKAVLIGVLYMDTIRDTVLQVFNNIMNIEMGVSDILDIAITAFVIYKIMGFISKTKSARIAKGVILVIAVMWLSDQLQLHVINWVFTKAIELGILALVVLFQPEIRRLLEQFGKNNITRLIFTHEVVGMETEFAITQTVNACTQMAKDKVGALIIFEREISLDDMINTGTIVNADISAELIKNIFFNKAPLHDGAVIIRDGKIAAAGCMVPLSNNANLSRDLGMRHRAGIGASEHSDAVVAVVSEETGSISFAVDGMLKRHLAPDTFETLLRNELMPPKDEDKKNKKFIDRFKGRRK